LIFDAWKHQCLPIHTGWVYGTTSLGIGSIDTHASKEDIGPARICYFWIRIVCTIMIYRANLMNLVPALAFVVPVLSFPPHFDVG
jgi:hypothetical protein